MTSKVFKTQRFAYCDFQYVMVQPWKEQTWLARNQENVTEWGDMSIRGLLLH
jgi:hypothetical protein